MGKHSRQMPIFYPDGCPTPKVQLPMTPEHAHQTLQTVRAARAIAAKRRAAPGVRKLQRYQQEISTLRQAGASQNDIKVWLRREKRVRVHQTTVHRFLQTLEPDKDDAP